MSKYKNLWKPMQMNKRFWREVFEGKVIKKITFDSSGVSSLILDSGETVFFPVTTGGRFYIKD